MTIRKFKTYKKKKKLCILICNFAFCILIFAFISGCAQTEIKNIDSGGKNVICFGDSLTSGEGASEGEDYPSLLSKRISLPVINAGRGGDTTYDALDRLQADVLDKDPLLVIVILGGNDFLKGIPLNETLKNLEAIVERIQRRGAMVALAEVRAGVFMKGYAREYRRIANRFGAIPIPNILEGILDKPNLKSDYIHPNSIGYQIMAERIYKAISPVIQLHLRRH